MRKVIISQLALDILNLHKEGCRGQELFEKSGAKTKAQFKTAYGTLGIENLFEDDNVILQIRGTKEIHVAAEVAEEAAVAFAKDAIENNEAALQTGIEHYYSWSERKGYLYDDLDAGATTEDIDFFFGGHALADMAKKSKKPFLIKALTTSEQVKAVVAPYCRTLNWAAISAELFQQEVEAGVWTSADSIGNPFDLLEAPTPVEQPQMTAEQYAYFDARFGSGAPEDLPFGGTTAPHAFTPEQIEAMANEVEDTGYASDEDYADTLSLADVMGFEPQAFSYGDSLLDDLFEADPYYEHSYNEDERMAEEMIAAQEANPEATLEEVYAMVGIQTFTDEELGLEEVSPF